jgi:hypothetical protein
MNAVPCSVCKEAGHRLDRCPELYAPLRPGFFAPSGGGGHSHDDDDDEKLKAITLTMMHTNGVYRISSLLRGSISPLQPSTSSTRV